jgi:hypothetical protein
VVVQPHGAALFQVVSRRDRELTTQGASSTEPDRSSKRALLTDTVLEVRTTCELAGSVNKPLAAIVKVVAYSATRAISRHTEVGRGSTLVG